MRADEEPVLERAVAVLRGMAYEHRLRILVALTAGERTPGALTEVVPADPTAVAHHLRFLLDAGLIRRRRRGRNVFYSLRDEPTRRLLGEVLRYAGLPA
ncbi:ArsR/SmtB family transcription factor [Nucisporomicrobium flavum]|uniref:ArsR/SmtB family transcription factor n=1 Tax=Nucisporomicrobium flavum TaxID=2785915 RepID=UPI0027DD5B79|nr:metalloregulator ArsR/SmtB family transcription factor [Nucisporomicrobium flavum]